MSNSQLKTIEVISDLMKTNAFAHILRTAFKVGIIDQLIQGQKTIDQICEACSLQKEPTEKLMVALLRTGLIEKYQEDFAVSQAGRLLPETLHDLGDNYWEHLEEYLKTGTTIPESKTNTKTDASFLADEAATEWMTTPAALEAIEILGIADKRKGCKILDIGAGSAVLAMAILHNDPASHVTAIDTSESLERTIDTAEAINIMDQLNLMAGDYREIQFPKKQFDLAILERVLYRETPETVQQVLKNTAQSLMMDGEVVIVDLFPGIEHGAMNLELYDLTLSMRMSTGQLHSPESLTRMLRIAGFRNIKFSPVDCPLGIHGMIVAQV